MFFWPDQRPLRDLTYWQQFFQLIVLAICTTYFFILVLGFSSIATDETCDYLQSSFGGYEIDCDEELIHDVLMSLAFTSLFVLMPGQLCMVALYQAYRDELAKQMTPK